MIRYRMIKDHVRGLDVVIAQQRFPKSDTQPHTVIYAAASAIHVERVADLFADGGRRAVRTLFRYLKQTAADRLEVKSPGEAVTVQIYSVDVDEFLQTWCKTKGYQEANDATPQGQEQASHE